VRSATITGLALVLFSVASTQAAGQTPDPAAGTQPAPRRSTPTTQPAKTGHSFIAINGGSQVDDHTFSETREQDVNQEKMSWTTDYAIERSGQYEGTVGGYGASGFGGALTYSFYQDNNSTAAVAARIPNPFQFNQDRQIQGQSASLRHREQVVHLSALYVVPIGSKLEIGVAGGPSLFIVNREFVDSVLYDEAYPFDAATFNSTTSREVKKNQAGFHVGADVSWFFTDNVGVGGMVRFSRAAVKFPAAVSDETISVDLGGVQAGFGLRVRLGGRKPPPPPPPTDRPPPEPDPTRIYATPDTPASPTDETFAVTLVATPIYVRPDASRTPLRVFEPNTRLKVMRQNGPWLRVEFQHPRYGRSEGYIETKNVRIIKPGAS
jgi:hypothetical protein